MPINLLKKMSAETQAPRSFSTMPPPPPASSGKISPSSALLFIIVFLAVIVFLSGLLHLLVRFLKKNRSFSSLNIIRSARYPEMSGSDDYQRRQLHHLFNLHDSGLDQVFIDALPIFKYKEIMGLKEPFDCAVCLCEFNDQEELRLLPLCSHAFHIDCIDTWLLSNSTCPLCRGALYNYTPGLPFENPVFEFQDSRDEDGVSSSSGDGFGVRSTGEKPADGIELEGEKRVFSVRLGKFRCSNNDQQWQGQGIRVGDVGQTSRSDMDTRRCYSMGSYQYVVSDSVNLQVALCPSGRDASDIGDGGSGNVLKLVGESVGRIGDFSTDGEAEQGKKIHIGSKNESFSVSKIWLWSKKGKFPSYSDAHVNVP